MGAVECLGTEAATIPSLDSEQTQRLRTDTDNPVPTVDCELLQRQSPSISSDFELPLKQEPSQSLD